MSLTWSLNVVRLFVIVCISVDFVLQPVKYSLIAASSGSVWASAGVSAAAASVSVVFSVAVVSSTAVSPSVVETVAAAPVCAVFVVCGTLFAWTVLSGAMLSRTCAAASSVTLPVCTELNIFSTIFSSVVLVWGTSFVWGSVSNGCSTSVSSCPGKVCCIVVSVFVSGSVFWAPFCAGGVLFSSGLIFCCVFSPFVFSSSAGAWFAWFSAILFVVFLSGLILSPWDSIDWTLVNVVFAISAFAFALNCKAFEFKSNSTPITPELDATDIPCAAYEYASITPKVFKPLLPP